MAPKEQRNAEVRAAIGRILLTYVLFALVFLVATEALFEISDGDNAEQSLAIRMSFVALSGAILAPVMWRELRQRQAAEVRLDEHRASTDAARDRRLEMLHRMGRGGPTPRCSLRSPSRRRPTWNTGSSCSSATPISARSTPCWRRRAGASARTPSHPATAPCARSMRSGCSIRPTTASSLLWWTPAANSPVPADPLTGCNSNWCSL